MTCAPNRWPSDHLVFDVLVGLLPRVVVHDLGRGQWTTPRPGMEPDSAGPQKPPPWEAHNGSLVGVSLFSMSN